MDKYLCVRVSLHGQTTLNHAKQHVRWRRSSGHSYADYSPVAKESLVHRVCKMDKSLASSGIQVDLVEILAWTPDTSLLEIPTKKGGNRSTLIWKVKLRLRLWLALTPHNISLADSKEHQQVFEVGGWRSRRLLHWTDSVHRGADLLVFDGG
jgi:hypothetical protein